MSFLSDILQRKKEEVADRRRLLPESVLLTRAQSQSPCRGFEQALSQRGEPLRVIAEVKRASPSLGPIRSDVEPAGLARRYQTAGAAAISVLTDGPGFGGSMEDLVAVRAAVSLPVLCKDFVVAPYQLLEARVAGADAILLIAAALVPGLLVELLAASRELGLDTLLEVHDRDELELALETRATLIGINNRNLSTFQIDLATGEALLPHLPGSVRAVAESGVRGRLDAERLRRAGAANLLVGEALVKALDPEALLHEILAVP